MGTYSVIAVAARWHDTNRHTCAPTNVLFVSVASISVSVIRTVSRITIATGCFNPISAWARITDVRFVLIACVKIRVIWARIGVSVNHWSDSSAGTRTTDFLSVFVANTSVIVTVVTSSGITVAIGWFNPITRARISDICFVLVAGSKMRVIWARIAIAVSHWSKPNACTETTDIVSVFVASTSVIVIETVSRITIATGWCNPVSTWARISDVSFVLIAGSKVRVIHAGLWVAVTARWLYSIVARSPSAYVGFILVAPRILRSNGSCRNLCWTWQLRPQQWLW